MTPGFLMVSSAVSSPLSFLGRKLLTKVSRGGNRFYPRLARGFAKSFLFSPRKLSTPKTGNFREPRP